jgi:hypothetical protein
MRATNVCGHGLGGMDLMTESECKISTQISNQISDFLVRRRRNHLHMMRVTTMCKHMGIMAMGLKSQASSRARGEFPRVEGCMIHVLHARYMCCTHDTTIDSFASEYKQELAESGLGVSRVGFGTYVSD